MVDELPIPPEVDGDERAREMIRVWLAHGTLNVSMTLGMWEDADDCDVDERDGWGELLADLMRHIANGMSQSHGWSRSDTIARIRRRLSEHLDDVEASVEGEYYED